MCSCFVFVVSSFILSLCFCSLFFFFNDTATTEIYTLSLHDALPISLRAGGGAAATVIDFVEKMSKILFGVIDRSEEHTSELQSHSDLVCRLLLEKKKKKRKNKYIVKKKKAKVSRNTSHRSRTLKLKL